MSTETNLRVFVVDDATPKLAVLRATLTALARRRAHLPTNDELNAALFKEPR